MEISEIASQLRQFVRQHYGVPEEDREFSDEVNLFDYGYVDSFGAVDLYAFIEKKFSFRFSEGDLVAVPLNTISEISSFIASRQKENL